MTRPGELGARQPAQPSRSAPASGIDLWADDVLRDPYSAYAELRRLGPVVHLSAHDLWAVTSHRETRTVLADHRRFTSTRGIALNDTVNEIGNGILAADPPEHDSMRLVLAEQLSPRGVGKLRDEIQQRADELVGSVVARGGFDAVTDLAEVFPVSLVAELIGIPEADRTGLLHYAESAFTCFGPWNDRTREHLPNWTEFLTFCATRATRANLLPDSWGVALYDAVDRGVISHRNAIELLGAYLGAGMDTTISAISSAVMLFAEHPDQWRLLRDEPSLLPSAFLEVLRMESPIQFFSRVTVSDVELAGTVLPAHSRVLVLYGCANRDQSHYPDADTFDIRRKPNDHLAFGFGLHGCAGQYLARTETLAVLQALLHRVDTITTGRPTYHLNNITRRLRSLPTTVGRAAATESQPTVSVHVSRSAR